MSLLWPILKQGLQTPRRVAVIDDQRQYTYGQLLGGAMFLAEKIDSLSSARHVGILLPTSGAFPIALLATWLARRTAVPLNYLLSPQELSYVIDDSDIDTIITVDAMIDFLEKGSGDQNGSATTAIPPDIQLLKMEQVDYSGVPPLRWPPAYFKDDLAVILYTSGTSGQPKGVMLTHGNLHSNVDAAIDHAALTNSDTFLGVLPQFHSFGLTALTLLPLRLGAKVVYSARFLPKKIVELIRRHRPDIFVAIPSMYGALLTVKDIQHEDFASIRLAISGGEPLPQETFQRCQERFNIRLLEGYGLTETAPMTNCCTPVRERQYSVGTALPGVSVQIVNDQNQPAQVGESGHILISGPNVMREYYKKPQESQQVFINFNSNNQSPVRYFRTGDIGKIDQEGFLYITGRHKEMLIIGGENVFPREIEEVLNHHESILDSAVIGQPDGLRGELPIAYVEIQEGSTFDEAELRSYCRQHLAGYKVPRQIHCVEALPRNAMGKILRRMLKN